MRGRDKAEDGDRGAPEGPYEGPRRQPVDLTYSSEMLEVIAFLSQLRGESSRAFDLGVDRREFGIILQLVQDHFTGRLTTPTSLADASGLSYGTAHRTIEAMLAEGLIVQRPRTSTGKSYSLHPSAVLLGRWQAFAHRTRQMIAARSVKGTGRPARMRRTRSKDDGTVIPPPAALQTKLTLSRGLRILVHADPTFMAMNALKRQFEMILGVQIHSRALSIDRLRREIVANSESRLSAYDIVACDLPWFGEMVDRDRLLALDDHIAASAMDLSDFLPDAVASTRRLGRQYGIPVLSTAELLVYRTDKFEDADVAPPRTTAQTLDAARRLHAPGQGMYGIAWNGGRGTALGHTFMVVMAAHGQPIVNLRPGRDGFQAEDALGEDLRPMFLSDTARATCEFLLDLMAYSPPQILSMNWYDRAQCYARGQAAMGYSHTLLANLFELDEASPAYGRTGYLPQPTGLSGRPISPLGGYALAIPRNIAPERIPAVWTALQTLTSANVAKLYVANGSLASPRFSVNRDPDVKAMSPLIGLVDTLTRQNVLRMWPRPPVPGISAIISIAGEEIHDMLKGEKSVVRALADAQNRADGMMRERGAY